MRSVIEAEGASGSKGEGWRGRIEKGRTEAQPQGTTPRTRTYERQHSPFGRYQGVPALCPAQRSRPPHADNPRSPLRSTALPNAGSARGVEAENVPPMWGLAVVHVSVLVRLPAAHCAAVAFMSLPQIFKSTSCTIATAARR